MSDPPDLPDHPHLPIVAADGIATVTIDRPEARNSLTPDMIDALFAALPALDRTPDVSVIVLTAVDPVFCAGLDLHALGSGAIDIAASTEAGNRWPARTTPMIGAVNGAAITGGLELALQCDFLVASERATFADTHTRVGILPWWGLSHLLPRAVGFRTARMMSTTGNFLDAAAALRAGLVAEVVEHGRLVERAHELAGDIRSNDPQGVGAMLDLYRAIEASDPSDWRAVERERGIAWQSEGFDHTEISRRLDAIMTRGRAQKEQR